MIYRSTSTAVYYRQRTLLPDVASLNIITTLYLVGVRMRTHRAYLLSLAPQLSRDVATDAFYAIKLPCSVER